MPKKAKKQSAKVAKSYRVIVDNADIRQQRGKRAATGKAKESRETLWPPLWQNLIQAVGSYHVLADLWGVSHMKVYRWGVQSDKHQPSRLETWGIRDFCKTRNLVSPI